MAERMRCLGVERYLRSEHTLLARTIKRMSPLEGEAYRNSSVKRVTDIVFSFPLAIASIPVIVGLGAARKLEDGQSPFYTQARLRKNGEVFSVVKLNAMRKGADSNPAIGIKHAKELRPEDDPRNTRVGRVMQRYDFIELPQLFQVLTGKLSLMGIRAAPLYIFDYLQKFRPLTYKGWREAYVVSRPGITSLNAVFNNCPKDDVKRYHFDMLYSRKASLGLDLLITYKTAVKLLRKFAGR